MLKIADRAKFKEVTKDEIEDIDLVFRISKLKNDHIKFKLNNFNKVGKTKVVWSVTKSTECDLGKWLQEQESSGKEFTRTENWKQLKLNHDSVHNCVQEYINEDCKEYSDNNILNSLSQKLDESTINVFKYLDQIKKDNVIKNVIPETSEKKKITSAPQIQSTQKSFVHESHKSDNASLSNKKSTVITSSSKDDDEWESF